MKIHRGSGVRVGDSVGVGEGVLVAEGTGSVDVGWGRSVGGTGEAILGKAVYVGAGTGSVERQLTSMNNMRMRSTSYKNPYSIKIIYNAIR